MYALALEGGGARGAAHIGVLRALQEYALLPDCIAGTSAGSIVAATYAWRGLLSDAQEALYYLQKHGKYIMDFNLSGLLAGLFSGITKHDLTYQGIFHGDHVLRWMEEYTHGATLTDTKMPLAIPSVDLLSGLVYTFSSQMPLYKTDTLWQTNAKLSQAVRASTAIPVVFCPYKMDNALLVDGGVLENLPVSPLLSLGYHKILGVVLRESHSRKEELNDVVSIAIRTMQVMQNKLEQIQETATTYNINIDFPIDSGLFSFAKMQEYETLGYNATVKAMPILKKLLLPSAPSIKIIRKYA